MLNFKINKAISADNDGRTHDNKMWWDCPEMSYQMLIVLYCILFGSLKCETFQNEKWYDNWGAWNMGSNCLGHNALE